MGLNLNTTPNIDCVIEAHSQLLLMLHEDWATENKVTFLLEGFSVITRLLFIAVAYVHYMGEHITCHTVRFHKVM